MRDCCLTRPLSVKPLPRARFVAYTCACVIIMITWKGVHHFGFMTYVPHAPPSPASFLPKVEEKNDWWFPSIVTCVSNGDGAALLQLMC